MVFVQEMPKRKRAQQAQPNWLHLPSVLLDRCLELSVDSVAAVQNAASVSPVWRARLVRGQCRIEIGKVSTRIGDISLSSPSTLAGLRQLDLSGSWSMRRNITDAGVQSLSVLSSLQQLNLRGCRNITDAGVQSLKRALGHQLSIAR